MTSLIISCISLIISISALFIAIWKKKEKLELRINDDLTGIENIEIECNGIRFH